MVFKITILGSNSAVPTIKRNPTAQLVNHNERFFLIDCAEGTQLQLRRYKIRFQRINHIFISHLHGDHFFGLIGLISTMHLLGRKKELHVYGPSKLEEIIQIQLDASQTELNYPFYFHPIDTETSELIYEDNKLEIHTIPLDHRIPTSGFLFKEKQGKRRLKKKMIAKYDIPIEKLSGIKNGDDYTDMNSHVIENEKLTDGPYPTRTYAYCSDTRYHEPIIPIIRNADLLYHETTFMNDRSEVAADKYHATTVEAATIAKKAEVKKLVIGHFSTRYDNTNELLQETKKVFANSDIASDGKEFDI